MTIFEKLYKELREQYGRPEGQWVLWCKRPRPGGARLAQNKGAAKTEREREEVAMGAILTQRTNWKNVELAMNNLKKVKANSLMGVKRLGKAKLGDLIRPSGFYKTKAGYLIGLADFIFDNYGGLAKMKKAEAGQLREKLLGLKGVGPETADSILLYALDKPIFVIDEYTRRLVKKRRLTDNLSYGFLQNFFEKNLERDFCLYQDFHALVVIDGKNSKG